MLSFVDRMRNFESYGDGKSGLLQHQMQVIRENKQPMIMAGSVLDGVQYSSWGSSGVECIGGEWRTRGSDKRTRIMMIILPRVYCQCVRTDLKFRARDSDESRDSTIRRTLVLVKTALGFFQLLGFVASSGH